MKFSIRLLYLYLFSFVGLIVAVIGMIQIVNLGLKVYVFNGADQYTMSVPVAPSPIEGGKVATQESALQTQQLQRDQQTELMRQRQRDFSGAIAMIIIGLPLYAYHWKIIRRENKR
jgi:hypothetical protein